MKRFILVVGLLLSTGILPVFGSESGGGFDWIKISPEINFKEINWSIIPEAVSPEMIESLISNPFISSKDPITIIQLDQELYALLPCRFEVLKWKGNNWENVYNGTSSGFNCNAHFFVKDDVIFSVGRYGFWHSHSEILYFDFESGFWENLSADHTPINYSGVGIYLTEDKIISINGEYIHQSSKVHETEINGYYFDFNKKSWFPLKLEIPNKTNYSNWNVPSFDLKDFGVHVYKFQAEEGLLILDKSDGSIYFSKKDFDSFAKYSLAVNTGNTLVLSNKSQGKIVLDLTDELDQSFVKVGSIEFYDIWPTNIEVSNNWYYLIIFTGLILLLAIILLYRKKFTPHDFRLTQESNEDITPDSKSESLNEELLNAIDLLKPYKNSSLEIDSFDEILGLNSISNIEYRRVKRSRLIKLINQNHKTESGEIYIERIRSDTDKRLVLYRLIQKATPIEVKDY